MWKNSPSSIFILDPDGCVRHKDLHDVLSDHTLGWAKEDILTQPSTGKGERGFLVERSISSTVKQFLAPSAIIFYVLGTTPLLD